MSTTGLLSMVPGPSKRGARRRLVPFGTGLIVAVALGVYGVVHEPTGKAVDLAGFSSALAAPRSPGSRRSAAVLAIVQWLGAGDVRQAPASGPVLDRGAASLVGARRVPLAVPVAMHCLYAVGFPAYIAAGAHPLPAGLLLLRRVHDEDAGSDPQERRRLGAAGPRWPGLHRLWSDLADLVAVVLHQHAVCNSSGVPGHGKELVR